MTESVGELFDHGYQHNLGPREGRMRARKAVVVNGVRTALGLGRGPTAKILPIILFAASMGPAVILALVASMAEGLDIPGQADYHQIVSIILIIFSAIIAPELLCADRRNGVINLYLVRPLTPTDYVAGRWLAFFAITLLLVYSGQVVLLVGLILSADEPLGYLRDNWLNIPRFISAGIVVAVFTTTMPLAVSAFTTRRAYAAAFVIGLFIISAAVSSILTECEEHRNDESGPRASGPGAETCEPLTGDAAKWFGLIDMGMIPIHVSDLIFGEENDSQFEDNVPAKDLSAIFPIVWYLLLTAGPGFALLWRYRRLAA
jgi:ABC-2 type transport system permease protein